MLSSDDFLASHQQQHPTTSLYEGGQLIVQVRGRTRNVLRKECASSSWQWLKSKQVYEMETIGSLQHDSGETLAADEQSA